LVAKSSDVINSSSNKRQELLTERIVRGEIRGSDGQVLAETIVDKEGKETRVYPFKNMFCHIVGNYNISKSGIELSEGFNLLTSSENPLVATYNALSGDKNIGDNVVTTLNVDLQKVAYDALGDARGAVVVMEPKTGKILAMVSKPDYDPNITLAEWNVFTENEKNNSVLVNRATQGLYPPGSTFKILTALEYIRENEKYEDYEYNCDGTDIFDSVKISCFNKNKHGAVNLEDSVAKSCNTSFANIGVGLNKASFRELCDSFLFNSELPTTLPYKKSSFVINKDSDKSAMPQTAIGQGDTLITPFHNALIVSTIANGGVLMNPYVVDRVENFHGDIIKKNMPSAYKTIISADESKKIAKFMEAVVEKGTASELQDIGVTAAGKTGSAEYDSKKSSHAWFIGFAPSNNPEIIVSVIVEGGGSGSKKALPIAKKVLKEYFK
jgi:penicillin-binding protein A